MAALTAKYQPYPSYRALWRRVARRNSCALGESVVSSILAAVQLSNVDKKSEEGQVADCAYATTLDVYYNEQIELVDS